MFMRSRPYTLYKSHQILTRANQYYRGQWKTLPPTTLEQLERLLSRLDQAIISQDRATANTLARELAAFDGQHFTRSWLRSAIEFVVAIAVALVIATLIRQVWFEPMKIPTGSMRPSFREIDHLIISKTAFGINTPLQTSHLYFDPSLLRRGGAVVFSADGLDMQETDTTYFWLFPAKKRLIKRLMGLPGDTIYFYGGKLYGIDRKGNDITPELNPPWMETLDHVPFANFEGKVSVQKLDPNNRVQQLLLKQMNEPVGKLTISSKGVDASVYDGAQWVPDVPGVRSYSDILGMNNYAMARLLTADEVAHVSEASLKDLKEGTLYLELRHHPILSHPKVRLQRVSDGQFHLQLPVETSLIVLTPEHLQALMNALYTVRFVVKDGRASAYAIEGTAPHRLSPSFGDIPDGTYELYHGKAYQVSWGGMTTLLPQDHPLNRMTPMNLQRLFNVGIEMLSAFEPQSKDQLNFPTRFAYFRDGDLYVMGGLVMRADDPALIDFVKRETALEESSRKERTYIAFKDRGAPYNEGALDRDLIRTFGMRIPDKHYLMLGDNYARSGDSRAFGFVPEDNIQGAPSWILWPPGDRWGAPVQTRYPWFTLPRLIVWAVAGLVGALWYVYTRWRMRQPQFKKLSR
jgi:signal peptidase I